MSFDQSTQRRSCRPSGRSQSVRQPAIGNESVSIQLAQRWFPWLAISKMRKYKSIFQIKCRLPKQFYQTALGNCYGLKLAKGRLQFKNEFIALLIVIFGTLSFPIGRVVSYSRTRVYTHLLVHVVVPMFFG